MARGRLRYPLRIRRNERRAEAPAQSLAELLQQGCDRLGIVLPPGAAGRLLDYVALLAKWNRAYNLTSVRKPQDMIARHLLDSLAVLPHLAGDTLLDVGTGAGLPGLVLAIASPQRQVVLLDSNGKKIRFLRQAVADLGVANAEVVQERLEAYRPEHRFDTLISRAFSSLEVMLAQGSPLCRPEGRLLAMKGVYPVAEMDALATKEQVVAVHRLEIPGLEAERHLVVMQPLSDDENTGHH